MNPELFYLLMGVLVLCIAGSVTGAYFYGFSRGARWQPEDPTPAWVPEVQDIAEEEVMVEVAYLPVTTGPVGIIMPATIDESTAEKLERSERLRKRYLRLLREERALTLSLIRGTSVAWTPYWRRAFARFNREVESYASSSSSEIANTR